MNLKRIAFGAATSAVMLGSFASAAFAAAPATPGCFGADRAAWLAANSGAEWGAIAPTRAGDNGAINQAYKTSCGGDPIK